LTFEAFLRVIFNGQCSTNITTHNDKLEPFLKAMFASLIRWLPEFISLVGMEHVVIHKLSEGVSACRNVFHFETLLSWSELVKTEFDMKNGLNLPSTLQDLETPLLPYMQQLGLSMGNQTSNEKFTKRKQQYKS
jgi:hypothetical protein